MKSIRYLIALSCVAALAAGYSAFAAEKSADKAKDKPACAACKDGKACDGKECKSADGKACKDCKTCKDAKEQKKDAKTPPKK